MILALPEPVRRRLDAIEKAEGIPPIELAHQAVDLWSQLPADERRTLGVVAMQLVVGRLRSGS